MLLSRVADALYWIGRYLERAEHAARVIDVRLDLGLDRSATGGGWDFAALYAGLEPDGAGGAAGESRGARRARDLRSRQPRIGDRLRDCRARQRAPGPRRDQLGHVGARQRPVSAPPKEARAEGTWSARPHYLSRLVIEGVHLFQGITDAHDGPRRRVAVSAGGPIPRARRRDGGAHRLHFRDETIAGNRPAITWQRPAASAGGTGPASCVRARRSRRTAASTRPTCAPIASPSSCC